ncbi:MAG: hypothetical protein AVDCRST_MAG24-383 [uncultured Nocardioidaceae bacterium]|uniref:Uncharacterized protein n=1 Tax=uncultured Nocardioidaceae bacterium TaxID=253824 RepID=A0A6J4L205_9ACTN|nr:MAG: hypothetical protein AVDCRST_MAG24-383 [uncultured Nocardioidaceae bacterium]
MCHPVRCRVCGKVTWAGCGAHVEQALAGIPEEHLCAGHAKRAPVPAPGPGPAPAPRG